MAERTIRVAVDIGGTFTDIQVLDLATGRLADFKAPSTPKDPSIGLIRGITGAAARHGFALDQVGMILHGSTIATNAVLERKLPKGALLTTAGFEDVLEIGRHMRHNVYALKAEKRTVLIPRDRRVGVAERIRADGSVEVPLDPAEVTGIGRRLADQGVEAVAVSFLHGFRNPTNEQAAAEALLAIAGLSVAISSETSPEVREFERTSTTVLNALLTPVISLYLGRVEAELARAGIAAPLYLVQSNGGLASPAETARLPARLLLSGPSGGAMAMTDLARRHGLADMVGIDMGGTSSDVSVVRGGRVEETAMGEIDGLPVRLPMVEIRTIGAGGGSLARVEGRGLRVGPESAGAVPGPASYGRGGVEPTVTDANLALGLIDADAFLGGEMALSVEAAEAALDRIAGPLGLDRETAAAGVLTVANAAMAGAVRLSLFEKGANPADFALVAFGGAGGLHACAIAEELEIGPGDLSVRRLDALGARDPDLGSAPRLSHSELMLAGPGAAARLTSIVGDLRARATALLHADDVAAGDRAIEIAADMRYRGQAFELTTPWTTVSADGPPPPSPRPSPQRGEGAQTSIKVKEAAIAALIAAFHALHLERYAHAAEDDPVEIVTVRARALGRMSRDLVLEAPPAMAAPGEMRRIWRDGWQKVPARRREAIAGPVAGPALVVEDYSVLWIAPGWVLRPATSGDLIAERANG